MSVPLSSNGSIQWRTPAASKISVTNGAPPAVRNRSRARADTAYESGLIGWVDRGCERGVKGRGERVS